MSVGILSGLLQYLPKNRAILVQKLGAEKKLSESVRPLREELFFLRIPLSLDPRPLAAVSGHVYFYICMIHMFLKLERPDIFERKSFLVVNEKFQ